MHFIDVNRFTIVVSCNSLEKVWSFLVIHYLLCANNNVHFGTSDLQSIMVVLLTGYKFEGLYDSINWTDFHSLLLKMDQFVKRFSLEILIL